VLRPGLMDPAGAVTPRAARCPSRRRAAGTAGPSCPSSRPGPRSSPPMRAAGPRCCRAAPHGARWSWAPTQSSTWPRWPPGSTGGRALTALDGEEVLEGVTLDPFGV